MTMINTSQKQRRTDLDVLKGGAILAVILYHMGILKAGYLGVDVFFVISGFLLIPRLIREIDRGQFNYWDFLIKRVFRLLPLLLAACVFCFVIGYYIMLPDDFENLCESIIASLLFFNNILAGITTKNYWNVANAYKPLMHTWYLGILLEFYVVFPLLIMAYKFVHDRIFRGKKYRYVLLMSLLSLGSLVIFLLPGLSASDKFYYLPTRFYELTFGGILGCIAADANKQSFINSRRVAVVNYVLLALLLISGLSINGFGRTVSSSVIGATENVTTGMLPNTMLVILTVLFSGLFLLTSNEILFGERILSSFGRKSYSYFIWHQIVLAFYRYTIAGEISVTLVVTTFLVFALLSELSYRFIERLQFKTWKSRTAILTVTIILCGASGLVYIQAGVVRDVPELDVSVSDIHRHRHSEYCDRIRRYDREFSENLNNIKVLVIGNSFARDWGNILLESEYADKIELSYSFSFKETLIPKIRRADRIFVFCSKRKVPDYVWENVKKQSVVFGIGTKNFGENNGIVYNKRRTDAYYDTCVKMVRGYEELNNKWIQEWGDHYINMISPVQNAEGLVKVFTENHKFISQDCSHLTKNGARFYADILEMDGYFIFE